MINLKRLIDLLPFYYREKDSYKDKQDKGLLERFLELIGECITTDEDMATSMLPNISNILDIIDVENTRSVFLDYIFDFLGMPPQEYVTPTYEGDYLHQPPYYVWYLEYNTPLESFTQFGRKNDTQFRPVKNYSLIDRKLIRYAISLYKIRGTKKFYEILLKSYFKLNGYTMMEELLTLQSNIKVRYDTNALYDSNYQYDGDSMDCKSCSSFIISLVDYNSILKPDEKERLRKTLTKYSPINVEFKVAYALAIINITLDGPTVPDGWIKVNKPDPIVIGYPATLSVSVEPEIEFLGWYDENGNFLSKSYSYTFDVEDSMNIYVKYKIEIE